MQAFLFVVSLAAAAHALGATPTWSPSRHSNVASMAQSGAQARNTQFRARLSPVPIDQTMQNTISGSGVVTATLAGTKLTVSGKFVDLKTAATMAQIHVGQKGVRGPAILDLTVEKATSGSIEGTFELSPQQLDDLMKSRLYVQLHSVKAPDGNLWGWLLPQEGRK